MKKLVITTLFLKTQKVMNYLRLVKIPTKYSLLKIISSSFMRVEKEIYFICTELTVNPMDMENMKLLTKD